MIPTICGLLLLSLVGPVLGVEPPASLLCPMVLEREQFARDELDLDAALTRLELEASDRIYALLEDLWKRNAVERLVFLRAKHDRDVSRLDHERARIKLARQEALLEQYRLTCGAAPGTKPDDDVRAGVQGAFERYRLANCDVLANDEQRAETDLTFFKEVLESTRDLRANHVATEQDVILSERNVEMASKSLAQARARQAACREEAPGDDPDDTEGDR